MHQITGWIVLRDSSEESDDARQEALTREVASLIATFRWAFGSIDLRLHNGEAFVTVANLTNHRGAEAEDLGRLLRLIGELGQGSFGVIHEWDDESRSWPGPQAFRVHVITRGTVTVREDPFFSPIAPTIEGSVRYPEMRAQIIEALQALADPAYQQRVWVEGRYPREGYYDDLTYNINVLYDDTAVIADPLAQVGVTLRDSREADAIGALGRSLDPVLAATQTATDAETLAHPAWPQVIAAAQVALDAFGSKARTTD
jgi:immunity protein 7 of polymorphic toxin system